MSKSKLSPDWHPTSWQNKPAQQQPEYKDKAALEQAVTQLSHLPPIVVSWEIEALKSHVDAAQRGERFILQSGDCAEVFSE